jgi:hypothetical protein
MPPMQQKPNPWLEKDAKKRASHPKRYARKMKKYYAPLKTLARPKQV